MENLHTLNISRNKLKILRNLPPNLVVLYAFGNNVNFINKFKIQSISTEKIETLKHLGLGSNEITDKVLIDILETYPNLRSLDLQQNLLEDFNYLTTTLNSKLI